MAREYVARILRVNLDNETVSTEKVDEQILRSYLGGNGLAAKIIWDETTATTDPFSPENPLIFLTGPLTGTVVPSSSRYIVAALSPLINIWGEAHAGGTWADELRRTGFDGIVFKGKAKRPVYLMVSDQEIKLLDAGHLWGKDTYETDALIKKEFDERASVAAIGQAGERLVRFASIMNDGKSGRCAAKCGLGAVMGSKNLKAIAVRGTGKPMVNDPERLREKVREYFPGPSGDKESRSQLMRGIARALWDLGTLPIKNFMEGDFKGFKEKMVEKFVGGDPHYCRRCSTSCGESKMEKDVRHTVVHVLASTGSNCLVDDMDAISDAFDLMQRYGMDCDSTGIVIGFAMEAYEKKLIGAADTGGVDLRWGNAEALVEMTRQIGMREGFGAVLGEGVKRAAEHIGGIAVESAMHVKGMEIPSWDPRATNVRALEYATNNQGAWHYNGSAVFPQGFMTNGEQLTRFASDGVAEFLIKAQNLSCLIDSLVVCKQVRSGIANYMGPEWPGIQEYQFLDWLNCITGWDMELAEFHLCGERIFNLQRMINVRRGISRKDDTLPSRLLTQGLKQGGTQGNLPPLGKMLDDYYELRGWTEEGLPTKPMLTQLGLGSLC